MLRWISKVAIVTATIAAIYIYFYKSTEVPAGYYVDSNSIALNAQCLSLLGTDEYGASYPLLIKSFGDYKPPLYTYAASLLFELFPPDVFTLRIFSMIMGLLAIAISLLFLRINFHSRENLNHGFYYLIFFVLFLFSPWVFATQRIPYEVTLTFFFLSILFSATFYVLKDPSNLVAGVIMGVSVGLLPHTYHSTKFSYLVHFPFLIISVLPSGKAQFFNLVTSRGFWVGLLICAVLSTPLALELLTEGNSLARFNVLGGRASISEFINAYFTHLNPEFLFFSGDTEIRHHSQYRGMLNLFFLPLLCCGVLFGVRKVISSRNSFLMYAICMFFLSFVPPSIKIESIPHALRANTALFPILFFSFYGMVEIISLLKAYLKHYPAIIFVLIAAWSLFGIRESKRSVTFYFTTFAHYNSFFWTYIKPDPAWDRDDNKVTPLDHSFGTVNERYYRLLKRNDLSYCNDQ
ncbi:MAG: hypothetical protein JNM27_07610 [Leptospirales bacterium]|nr:hypothetical protein [Leptospirales bacterium]